MAGIARITIVGNLGRDAEMKSLPSGSPVLEFSVAVSRKAKDGTERTAWYRVSAFGQLADTLAGLEMTKGRQVYVDGRLDPREYEGKDGTNKTSLDVYASEVQVLGGRPGADTGEIPF